MATKRGRPRKDKPGTGRQALPFEALPDGELSTAQAKQVAGWFRDYVKKPPTMMFGDSRYVEKFVSNHVSKLNDNPDFQAWLSAAAQSISDGDATRTGYYLFNAMRLQKMVLYQEMIQLAGKGYAKDAGDKKRGHRGTDGPDIELNQVTRKK